jgi:hypothetical protein
MEQGIGCGGREAGFCFRRNDKQKSIAFFGLIVLDVSCEGRAARDAHLSRDETAAKMGHPDFLGLRQFLPK